ERHGGFEKYREAKGKLFARLTARRKNIAGQPIKKISVINLDDAQAQYFLQFPADEHYGFTAAEPAQTWPATIKVVRAAKINLHDAGAEFEVANPPRLDNSLVEANPPRLGEAGQPCKIHLLGRFNVINALAAVTVAISQDIDLATCGRALEKIISMAGRMEIVRSDPFTVVVDYAHTPDEIEAVYKTFKKNNQRLICVLGAAGGGRDKWKRPEFGRIADNYAAEIIITNEDPYDEDPQQIIEQVAAGAVRHVVHKILDRREAIKLAISLVQPGDVVIITGKGSEQCIMGPNGQKTLWDDRQVVRDVLAKTERQTKIS
ncbi:MAG: Mur ligase family protein, partial [Candidatus Parcubacteria bacterium]|nr:Mur ligase family protein [Candidatus Parcubacteria bacterium]